MVGEFPELQGLMGKYYAQHDGEDAEVATALEEQYWPRFAGDKLPATKTGIALSIADKLDTIAGIFCIGQKPTGTRDPFGLRRAALGILRTIIEHKLDLDLRRLVDGAVSLQPVAAPENVGEEIWSYLMERMRSVLSRGSCRSRGHHRNVRRCAGEQAAFAARHRHSPAGAWRSSSRCLKRPAWPRRTNASLISCAKRPAICRARSIRRSCRKARNGNCSITSFRWSGRSIRCSRDVNTPAALTQLATLREDVDRFFDSVMVMADDPEVRANRLGLLVRLRGLFLQVADLSRLPG